MASFPYITADLVIFGFPAPGFAVAGCSPTKISDKISAPSPFKTNRKMNYISIDYAESAKIWLVFQYPERVLCVCIARGFLGP